MGGRELEVGSCPWLAFVAGIEGYFLAGVEIACGVLSCKFLYFCGC